MKKYTRVSPQQFVKMAVEFLGTNVLSYKDMERVREEFSVTIPTLLNPRQDRANTASVKIDKYNYRLPTVEELDNYMGCNEQFNNVVSVVKPAENNMKVNLEKIVDPVKESKKTITVVESDVISYIPEKDQTYVPFGHYKDLLQIFKSEIFYPVYITGQSGNGKTMGIRQAAAILNRELIRVNFTVETDEDDLLGGFRLIDGETVWSDGPVVTAMKRGAILLLDEVDLGGTKIMALQSVLEGNGVFLKKIGKQVNPSKGFTIVATGNTKGKGSDDGRFIGTNVMNEAFLDRFKATIEQPYPTEAIEKKILVSNMKKLVNDVDASSESFIDTITKWGKYIRESFDNGGCNENISTRRLVDVVTTYSIFNDKEKAISLCISRFDEETQLSFKDLYDKLTDDESSEQEVVEKEYTPEF